MLFFNNKDMLCLRLMIIIKYTYNKKPSPRPKNIFETVRNNQIAFHTYHVK